MQTIHIIKLPDNYLLKIGDVVYVGFRDYHTENVIGYCQGEIIKVYNGKFHKTATVLLEDGKTKILNKLDDIYTTVDLLRDTNLKRLIE